MLTSHIVNQWDSENTGMILRELNTFDEVFLTFHWLTQMGILSVA
jgi:hypothetical protein